MAPGWACGAAVGPLHDQQGSRNAPPGTPPKSRHRLETDSKCAVAREWGPSGPEAGSGRGVPGPPPQGSRTGPQETRQARPARARLTPPWTAGLLKRPPRDPPQKPSQTRNGLKRCCGSRIGPLWSRNGFWRRSAKGPPPGVPERVPRRPAGGAGGGRGEGTASQNGSPDPPPKGLPRGAISDRKRTKKELWLENGASLVSKRGQEEGPQRGTILPRGRKTKHPKRYPK